MALQNCFRKGTITALRELAQGRNADNSDTALERYMQEHAIAAPWAAIGRIIVAVDDKPFSRDLIRCGWHLARDLKAPLMAVNVSSTSALARLAKERHIAQIVVGKSHRSKLLQLFRLSMSRRLLGMVTQDIHIVSL
jgi:K+-sensing histidine kinase KdpD